MDSDPDQADAGHVDDTTQSTCHGVGHRMTNGSTDT